MLFFYFCVCVYLHLDYVSENVFFLFFFKITGRW
jgi:hypothetical protein